MKKASTDTSVAVSIPAIEIKTFTLRIVGETPLISHAWDEKAKREMLEKQMKKASKGREVRNPFNEFISSLYWLTDKPENPTMDDVKNAKFGFPVVGFKAAAVSGGFRSNVVKNKTIPNGAFHINGEFAEIEGTPEIREDMVRIGMGTADLRYRGEFKNWATTLTIRCNINVMSMEQIINLFNIGGFSCGVGEWRPEKGGSNGMFHVE
jgi:hypothetical protein